MIPLAFGDTYFFVALLDVTDPGHTRAMQLHLKLHRLVTSDFVLIEFLNSLSGRRHHMRKVAIRWINKLRSDPDVRIVKCSRETFDDAFGLYVDRLDKQWSLTGCSSFIIMRELGLDAELTADKHFVQAGLNPLLLQPD